MNLSAADEKDGAMALEIAHKISTQIFTEVKKAFHDRENADYMSAALATTQIVVEMVISSFFNVAGEKPTPEMVEDLISIFHRSVLDSVKYNVFNRDESKH